MYLSLLFLGMNISFVGFGFLIGSPITGALINIQERRFTNGFLFAASTLMAASVVIIVGEILMLKRKSLLQS
jgi:hypothetical protein